MASRTVSGNVRLPAMDRRSVPVTGLPQVDIPQMTGGAARLQALGAITREAALTVSAIDRKNQEVAAEKQFTSIFLEAQKEINDFHSQATGDEDISAQTLAIYEKHMNSLGERGLPPVQAEIIREKMLARQTAVGQKGLDYELKLKSQKYDADLNATIENAANIVATDPRLFNDQLANIEQLIDTSRLNGAEKAGKLKSARELMGRVYLSRLSELNPAKARAEANSKNMNAIIDPAFKTSLLGKLDAEARAQSSMALKKDISDIDRARKLGVAVPGQLILDTANRARRAGDERTAKELEIYANVQDYNIEFAQKSLSDQQFELKELRMKAQLGNLSDLDRLEVATETYREKVTGIAKDPWSYYAGKGVIQEPAGSLVGATPDAAAALLAERRLAREKIDQLEGGRVPLPLLTPGEIGQLTEMKGTADPKQLAATLVSIGGSMDGGERRATVQAVAAKEPLLAVAMGQDLDTASRLIAGSRASGEVTPAKVREKVVPALQGITMDGAVNDSFHDAIYAYYKQLALEKGETSKEAQSDLIEQAVRDVVGEVVEVNLGRPSRLIAPAGMTAWQIEDRLGSLTDDVLKEQQGQLPQTSDGSSATAADILRFGRFLSAGDGVVAVSLPTGTLYRADGQLYTIDLKAIDEIKPYRRKADALLKSRTGGAGARQ